MGSYFTVGALALAAEGANAVGAVRMTLLDETLEIDLLKVGSYRESFLPGALTESVRFAVPYTAIRGLVRRGAVLYLALDAKVASPYHRFALTRFSDQPMDGLIGAHHRRMRARLAAALLPAPASTLALVLAPEWLVAGALGKASLAVVVALATWALCRAALSLRTHGGPESDEFRDAFEQRTLERLGLRPAWLADEAPFDAPLAHALLARAESAPRPLRGAPPGWPEPPVDVTPAPAAIMRRTEAIARATPPPATAVYAPVPPATPLRSMPLPLAPAPSALARAATSPAALRGAMAAVGAACLLVLALTAGRSILDGTAKDEPRDPASAPEGPVEVASLTARGASATPAAPPAAPSASAAPASKLPRCTCERSDSPLWETPLPLLSVLPIPTRRRDDGGLEEDIAPRADARGRMRYEFDLAIVNNGKDDLSDVKLVLTFARRDDRGERVSATDRGLFWEGALRPGRSVKWSVKAPGTELRIDADEKRTLADVAAADGDAFFGLLKARQPAVRLHGATMLAYVGDPRAEGAARALDGLAAAQEPIRQMVVRAASALRVCEAKVAGDALSACVYNTTDVDLERPSLVEPSEGGRRVRLEDRVPPHEGLRATFPGFGARPAELVVER